MRRALGYLWCSLFALQVSAWDTTVLNYQQLLDSWNSQVSAVFPTYQPQDTVSEIIDWLYSNAGGFDITECWTSCADMVYFAAPNTYGYSQAQCSIPWRAFPNYLPYQFEFFRRNSSRPAGLVVKFQNALTNNVYPYVIVPWSACTSYTVFQYAPLWESVREAVALGQNGHLPVALACLTYPGFTQWCSTNRGATLTVTNAVNDVYTGGVIASTLCARAFAVRWQTVLDRWIPWVVEQIGFEGGTRFIQDATPIIRTTWRPFFATGPVHSAPSYPGPFWYQNDNQCVDGVPEYVLSYSALQQIHGELDGSGYTDVIGDPTFDCYMVAGADDDGRARIDFRFSLQALVSGIVQ